MTGLGIAMGIVGGGLASGALVTLLFGVSRLDSATYLGVIALLALCVGGCLHPAGVAGDADSSLDLTSE